MRKHRDKYLKYSVNFNGLIPETQRIWLFRQILIKIWMVS
jgi:hypothetical protein